MGSSRPPRWWTATTSSARPGPTPPRRPTPTRSTTRATAPTSPTSSRAAVASPRVPRSWRVKVCSAVATSCNGVALLQGMDFALDPNGDGAITDAVDVVNMSLGSSYGQQEDDLSFASQNAVDAGVTVVVSAGNSADRPYIAGSPSTTPGVISVAQTQVPSAVAYPLVVDRHHAVHHHATPPPSTGPRSGPASAAHVVRLGHGLRGRALLRRQQPGRQGRADRPRHLLRQPQGGPRHQGRGRRRPGRQQRRAAIRRPSASAAATCPWCRRWSSPRPTATGSRPRSARRASTGRRRHRQPGRHRPAGGQHGCLVLARSVDELRRDQARHRRPRRVGLGDRRAPGPGPGVRRHLRRRADGLRCGSAAAVARPGRRPR